MEKTEYQVRVQGNDIVSRHRSKAAAIKAAKQEPEHIEPKVVMHVISGTHQSHTCVWPVRGETYSN